MIRVIVIRPSLQQATEYREERESSYPVGGPVELKINTRVPSKWRFVDLETADVWCWKDGRFRQADDVQRRVLSEARTD